MQNLCDYIVELNPACFERHDFQNVSKFKEWLLREREDLSEDINGRHVIILEDIIDTGLTARFLTDLFKIKHHPKKLIFASLLNKKCARQIEIEPDFYGFEVDDKFVVGYGLDYKGYFRNLPYIGYFPQ
jgi:hypoxanthine phosphoribosyltransferase